jgi:glycosyltransferase involved in cell wall biosynthesis
VDLLRKGRRVACTIVGDGPERVRLQQLATALGIDSIVSFAGYVDQDKIQAYYDRANAFVLASFAEGVPVVLMEAMAKSLPVIATRITGIPELIEDGQNGLLVTPARVDELVAAVEKLIDDPDLRRRMGQQARIQIETHFNVVTIGRQVRTLLEQAGLLVESDLVHAAAAHAS